MSISKRKLRNIFKLTSIEGIKNANGSVHDTPWLPLAEKVKPITPSAIIYCEGNFGKIDGKTANGLVRHSLGYRILSVVDSERAGLDAGEVLDNKANGIPIVANIEEAITHAKSIPDYFIFGIAPSSGFLSELDKSIILNAMSLKMNIVNGLHEFLTEDPLFLESSLKNHVRIIDTRKPKSKGELRTFNGEIHNVKCPRIAVMGTDCAIGKRTTATILANELTKKGLRVALIATGQTGIMQGARYCVALDAVPSQFCAGELESVIVQAYEAENPDIIIIEGQGALSHPAFSTSAFILRGSCPTGVILQHAPTRLYRSDFPVCPMPSISSEINLIETFSNTCVIGLTLNHEGMSLSETRRAIDNYTTEFDLPVTDALSEPVEHLLHIVISAFPIIASKLGEKG
ncbi:EBNA-1 nuclear protein [Vibrio crassostreae]|nr:EBNA-1 nuclear protein [Vibrio chagasii]CAK2100994.1 EBNA-1 nuclear protein [Vibrio crassostreae]CAH7224967.1 EBNA-1 nuclear protein [Vibrio chagasii]CAK2102410.1 EBNA-1 nuclear protein [Vibrio crassostreae]CAK2108052.1 EBNA-1 nuclear protein [Vibrio crassostreae]